MESGPGMDNVRCAGPERAAVGEERHPADRFRKLTLPVDAPDTGRVARDMVTVTLNDWGLAPLADSVRSCVSELVGNAREHAVPDGRSPLRGSVLAVTLRLWPGWLLVDVEDGDSTAPTLPEGEPFTSGLADELPEALLPDRGRGLHIVRQLSDFVWWAPRDQGGKSVCCRFDLGGRSDSGGPPGR